MSAQIGAQKHTQSKERQSSRSGYRPRRFDTRAGTLYLLVPKVRKGSYIPFFVTERKRSEAALIQVVQEAYINGVSTRKIEKLAQALAIEPMLEESLETYNALFEKLKDRGLSTPSLVISDAHKGLVR